jgi:hypothetical protein
MAFFGLFGKKGDESSLRKHAERVANRRIAAPDRQESLYRLASLGTPEAAEALLGRFTIYSDPSITDQEEKEAAYEGILKAGTAAVEKVVKFMQRAESLSWPIRILDQLLTPEQVVGELLTLLAAMDTEYARDPQRKVQILAALEERKDARIVAAVERFLEDVNELSRFHALSTVFGQDNAETALEALRRMFAKEDSMRIKSALLERFAERAWVIAEGPTKAVLPAGWTLDKGVPIKK